MLNVAAISESSKLDKTGEIVVVLKVGASGAEGALDLVKMIGLDLNVTNVDGEILDVVHALSVSAKLKDGEVVGTARLAGGRALQKTVGTLLRLGPAQPALPGTV